MWSLLPRRYNIADGGGFIRLLMRSGTAFILFFHMCVSYRQIAFRHKNNVCCIWWRPLYYPFFYLKWGALKRQQQGLNDVDDDDDYFYYYPTILATIILGVYIKCLQALIICSCFWSVCRFLNFHLNYHDILMQFFSL